ncbi:MAG: serine/threonine protein phosphatase 1 [Bacteroidia bacterium]|jgi:serine/threonine protein phosphatase 1
MANESAKHLQVPAPNAGGRQLVIGDVHGCAKTLDALLRKMKVSPLDHLFFLGDLVNRGPDSGMVIDQILRLQENNFQVFVLRGNHEQLVLDAAKVSNEELLATLKSRNSLSLLRKKGTLKKRYKRFMKNTLHYIELDKFYLVHAGFNLKKKDPFSDAHAMLWKRPFRPKKKMNGKRVLYGHNPRRWQDIKQAVDMKLPHIGLDNGCVHTHLSEKYGRLVCLELGTMTLHKQVNCE